MHRLGWMRPPFPLASLFSISSLFAAVPVATARSVPPCLAEVAQLHRPGGAGGDRFGSAVAVDGFTVVVGAPNSDAIAVDSGSAYVFVRSGSSWSYHAELLASDGAYFDRFGSSVAIRGDIAAVGAPFDDDQGNESGSVYLFARSAGVWSQRAKLVAPDGVAHANFGSTLAMTDDILIVGAPLDDDRGPNSGSVYVFVRNGPVWILQAKLLAADGASNARFGTSVAIDGETALVGAYFYATGVGSAYVFLRDGSMWSQKAKLVASGSSYAEFGSAVAVEGDRCLIGAPSDVLGMGAAYVYSRTGPAWHLELKLRLRTPDSTDLAGRSVALSGDTAFLGVPEAGAGIGPGAVVPFAQQSGRWFEQAHLRGSDSMDTDEFGSALAVDGGVLVSGSPENDDLGTNAGAAFVFERVPPPGTAYCTCDVGCSSANETAGCNNALGHGAVLGGIGRTSPDELALLVDGARPGRLAIFFQGNSAVMLPFGSGFLCANGGVVRLGPPRPAESDGTAGFGPCFGDPSISVVTGVVPGSGRTKRYQYWYRDPNGPCGTSFNLTNGYEITW